MVDVAKREDRMLDTIADLIRQRDELIARNLELSEIVEAQR